MSRSPGGSRWWPLEVEVYVCVADVPEFSTYRHVYATISRCKLEKVSKIEELPRSLAERLLARGEVLVTEPGSELLSALGIGELRSYQYVRLRIRGTGQQP